MPPPRPKLARSKLAREKQNAKMLELLTKHGENGCSLETLLTEYRQCGSATQPLDLQGHPSTLAYVKSLSNRVDAKMSPAAIHYKSVDNEAEAEELWFVRLKDGPSTSTQDVETTEMAVSTDFAAQLLRELEAVKDTPADSNNNVEESLGDKLMFQLNLNELEPTSSSSCRHPLFQTVNLAKQPLLVDGSTTELLLEHSTQHITSEFIASCNDPDDLVVLLIITNVSPSITLSVIQQRFYKTEGAANGITDILSLRLAMHSCYESVDGSMYNLELDTLNIGALVACLFGASWHRCNVDEIDRITKTVVVSCVDTGVLSKVSISQIKALREDFITFPAQACKASLFNVHVIDESSVLQYLKSEKLHRQIWCRVERINNADGTVELTLLDTEDGDGNLNEHIVRQGWAVVPFVPSSMPTHNPTSFNVDAPEFVPTFSSEYLARSEPLYSAWSCVQPTPPSLSDETGAAPSPSGSTENDKAYLPILHTEGTGLSASAEEFIPTANLSESFPKVDGASIFPDEKFDFGLNSELRRFAEEFVLKDEGAHGDEKQNKRSNPFALSSPVSPHGTNPAAREFVPFVQQQQQTPLLPTAPYRCLGQPQVLAVPQSMLPPHPLHAQQLLHQQMLLQRQVMAQQQVIAQQQAQQQVLAQQLMMQQPQQLMMQQLQATPMLSVHPQLMTVPRQAPFIIPGVPHHVPNPVLTTMQKTPPPPTGFGTPPPNVVATPPQPPPAPPLPNVTPLPLLLATPSPALSEPPPPKPIVVAEFTMPCVNDVIRSSI